MVRAEIVHASRVACIAASIAFFSLAARAEAPEPSSLPPDADARIQRLFSEAVGKNFMPGASVAVALDSGRSYSRHFGRSSMRRDNPVTEATRFRVGSISKLVTAAAVLKLAQEGRLGLRTPVASLLPGDAAIAKLPSSVTVERLLNHTSGLPDFTKAELEAKVGRGVSTDSDLEIVLERPLRAPPGREWAYADAPYRILSRVVERVSGLSYGAYVSGRLAPALGLTSLGLCDPSAPEQAEGYLSQDGALRREPAYAIRGLLGEGGLCATAADLARLPLSLVRTGWLSRASLARMIAATRLEDGTVVDYGLGVRGGLLGGHKAWGHTGGGLHGSWAAVAFYPRKGVSVAVTANGTGASVDAATLQAQVAAIVLGVEPPGSAAPSASLASAVAGAYARGGQITCVSRSGGNLVRTRAGSSAAPTPLFPQGGTVFARPDYPLDRHVFQLKGRSAVAYRVYYDGLFAEYWRRAPARACQPPGSPAPSAPFASIRPRIVAQRK